MSKVVSIGRIDAKIAELLTEAESYRGEPDIRDFSKSAYLRMSERVFAIDILGELLKESNVY